MTNRRKLTEGIKPAAPPVDTQLEREFVYQSGNTAAPKPPIATAPTLTTQTIQRVPISMRIRGDLAGALKRASLQRQLENVSPNTLQEMLEEALEPWLKSNGYLD
jgi:hypothetical protein